jgi:putative oxidoreductase
LLDLSSLKYSTIATLSTREKPIAKSMTYFAAFMWLAIAGPGAASLDRLLVNAAGHADAST